MAERKKQTKNSAREIFSEAVMKHGFTAVPNILVRAQGRLKLTSTQFAIVVQLLSYWYEPGRPPFPSKEDLARHLGMSKATVRENVAKLEQRGLIRREQQVTAAGDYGSNKYHLDGLVAALQKLVPEFDEEREERRARKAEIETHTRCDAARDRQRRRDAAGR